MNNKCLFCYRYLEDSQSEFHKRCSKKIFDISVPPQLDFNRGDIEALASEAINRSLSVPGVQPKLSLEIVRQGPVKRLTIVGLWGNYILKPPTSEYPHLPENEDLTMHLAEMMKIDTSLHSLIRFKSGELAYITKRFDREKEKKIAVEDMNQIAGKLTADKYYSSMEKVGKLISRYSDFSYFDILKLYKLTIFCFLTGNADMHLKNFSLIRNKDDTINLSPSYDLLATKLLIPADKEEIALTLNGKKANLTLRDFIKFSKNLGIEEKVRLNIFGEFKTRIDDLLKFIDNSFLPSKVIIDYKDLITERAKRLNLV